MTNEKLTSDKHMNDHKEQDYRDFEPSSFRNDIHPLNANQNQINNLRNEYNNEVNRLYYKA